MRRAMRLGIVRGSLLVAVVFLLPLDGAAQILPHMLLADDGEPQTMFVIHPNINHSWPGYAIGYVSPDVGEIRALATRSWYDEATYGTARDEQSGEYYLVRIDEDNFSIIIARVGTEPIGFPEVEGLAAVEETLYGVSFDTTTSRSTLLEIDPFTGIGVSIGQTSVEVRFVGLAFRWHSGGQDHYGLWAISGPHGKEQHSALYEVDILTGAESHVTDLPTACEGLGTNYDDYLVASGHEHYSINPFANPVEVTPVNLDVGSSAMGQVVGVGDTFFPSPTVRTTWGRLKFIYR